MDGLELKKKRQQNLRKQQNYLDMTDDYIIILN